MFWRGVVLLTVAAAVGCLGPLPPLPPRPAVGVKFTDLLAEYKKNPAAATEKYDGKDVVFAAYLREVHTTGGGQTYFLATAAPDAPLFDGTIYVYTLSPASYAALKEFDVGDEVWVQAQILQKPDSDLRVACVSLRKPQAAAQTPPPRSSPRK